MKKILSIILVTILAISITACSSKSSNQGTTQTDGEESSLQNIIDKGVLVLGTSADYAPYEFHIINENGEDEIVGFDIAIAKEIADAIGVELKIVDMSFDGLLTSLNSKQVDMVISGMTPTVERAEAVDFSSIYYNAEQAIIVRDEDAEKLSTLEDLIGKKVGAQRSTIQEQMVTLQIEGSNLVSLAKISSVILELKNGTVDAAVLEKPVAQGYIKRHPELVISEANVHDPTGASAIAMRKGSTSLVNKVNEVIDELKSSNKIEDFILEANEYISIQSE